MQINLTIPTEYKLLSVQAVPEGYRLSVCFEYFFEDNQKVLVMSAVAETLEEALDEIVTNHAVEFEAAKAKEEKRLEYIAKLKADRSKKVKPLSEIANGIKLDLSGLGL